MAATSGGELPQIIEPQAPLSPLRRRLMRVKRSGVDLNDPQSPSPSLSEDDETESRSSEDEGEDPLPDKDPAILGPVTFKEAIEGLFSTKTVQSNHHE